jgi:thiamine biosynthesis lipoprotein
MASQFNFEAIGTQWQIDIYEALSPEQEAALLIAIRERIDIFDKHYSRFRSDSLVTEISQRAGQYEMPSDFKIMYDIYKTMYELSDGLMTPLIGQTLVDAGYDAQYSLQQKNDLKKPPTWEEVIDWDVQHSMLDIKQPVLLDFGAAGKGYLVDIVGKVIEDQHIYRYCIDAGGDILHRNGEPIIIGLEHPEYIEQVIGTITLQNNSLCGSSGNRRKWQGKDREIHHIINPKTLTSNNDIVAVWVMASSTILADALTTCLFFTPINILRDHFTFDYVIMHADHSVEHSLDFPTELFT